MTLPVITPGVTGAGVDGAVVAGGAVGVDVAGEAVGVGVAFDTALVAQAPSVKAKTSDAATERAVIK